MYKFIKIYFNNIYNNKYPLIWINVFNIKNIYGGLKLSNFKVYNIKLNKIFKYIIVIIIVILVIKIISNKVQAIELENNNIISTQVNKVSNETLKDYFGKTLAIFSAENREETQNNEIYISVKNILKYELGTLSKIIEDESLNVNEEELTNEDKAELLEYEEVETEVQESIVEETFSEKIETVKIKNTSDYKITKEMLEEAEKSDCNFSRNVLIFHTHTCESYTPEKGYEYKKSGNFRTTDLNFSVARVGEELEKNLTDLRFNVIHDKTYHDFPAYSGSYTRSYETIEKLINENKDYDIIIDIHRDAVGSDGLYAPTVKIGEEFVAQLMFVIGTDAGGLEHKNWKENLNFAVKVQSKANELYPGLFKPIMISNSRFNQNLGKGACIIEVGATGNTLKQAVNSMKYLSIVLDQVV